MKTAISGKVITMKDNKEFVEFQPDALEIKNGALPCWARYSVLYVFVLLACALIWAIVFKVDVIVQAPGKLVSAQPNIVMKPLERAVIKSVRVQIGDVVEAGDVMITFDPTAEFAELERLQHECAALLAEYNRLKAEYDGVPYAPEFPLSDIEAVQLSIFRQRSSYYEERLKYYNQSIEQLQVSRKSCSDILITQKERLATIVDIENAFKNLDELGAATPLELLQNQMSRLEIEGAVLQTEARLQEMGPQINTALAARDSFIQEWHNGVAENLFKTERELLNSQKALEKVENLINFVELRSPCRAMVHEIAAFSMGSAVREAEALVTLIPLDGEIELETEVRAMDIAKVMVGSDVRIKLMAYPFQKYGTLDGRIRTISEDTFQRQPGQSSAPENSGTYYRARVSIAGTLDNAPKNFRMIPGMEAQAEIKCGRRRIIEYLIYPLIKAFDEAAREP